MGIGLDNLLLKEVHTIALAQGAMVDLSAVGERAGLPAGGAMVLAGAGGGMGKAAALAASSGPWAVATVHMHVCTCLHAAQCLCRREPTGRACACCSPPTSLLQWAL